MRAKRILTTMIAALCVVLVAGLALAAVPQTINYQGYLTNSSGQQLNGPMNLTFALYGADSGGSALWNETHTNVAVTNGVYSVVLGNGSPTLSPLTLPFDAQYYLGITVGTDPEMTPRQALAVAPYAFRAVAADSATNATNAAQAVNADTLDNQHASAFATSGHSHSSLSDLTLSGSLTLSYPGLITLSGYPLMHVSGDYNNFFSGTGAGSLTNAGHDNTAIGNYDMADLQSGSENSALGSGALRSITDGTGNTAIGAHSLTNNLTGSLNTAVGMNALAGNTVNYNTAVGGYSLGSNTLGTNNSALGIYALGANTTGYANTASGMNALYYNTTGYQNTAIGFGAGANQTTGSNNIYVGYNVPGVAGESNVTRIGNDQTQTYIAGTVTATGFVGDGSGLTNLPAGAGDITGVSAGTGLTGGGTTGDVTLTADATYLQRRVSSSCGAGSSIRTINADGTVVCESDDDTIYTAGTGLNLTGTQFSVASTYQQRRVSSSCAAGSSIRTINEDGTVVCESDDDTIYTAGTGLNLTGTQFSVASTYQDGSAYDSRFINIAGDIMTGNLTAPDITLTGNLNLPATTATTGIIKSGGNRLIHTYGTDNFFAGINAGNLTMTGDYNTGSGAAVLSANTTGFDNTASGNSALTSNTTGHSNVASGATALYSNTTGNYNTASGAVALYSNTTGNYNTASGAVALNSNTTGSSNTASGSEALMNNTTGNNNTASGAIALYSNITGNNNTASGAAALNSNTTGSYNTASGTNALTSNTTGHDNVASGYNALFSNSTAGKNTAVGSSALYTQSYNNGGIAWDSHNTAVGFEALYSNQPTSSLDGDDNTALGSLALRSNTTGNFNTASGVNVLSSNTIGISNTASGVNALNFNTIGNFNTASGVNALSSNTIGSGNTASGKSALDANTTGSGNTASGTRALTSNTTGNNNTALGYYADVASGDLTNATVIGAHATVNASNKVRIGDAAVTVIEGQVGWSFPSDIRIKKDVEDIGFGLAFIKSLRPVQYRLKQGNDRIDFGFIAQEVEAQLGVDYNVLGIAEDADRSLSLRYTDFIAPMVKAMQEQQETIENQDIKIQSLEERLARLEALMSKR